MHSAIVIMIHQLNRMLPKSQKVLFGARSLIHKKYWLTHALILLLQQKVVTKKRRFTNTFLQSTDIFMQFTDIFLQFSDSTMLIYWHRDFSACESKEHKNEYDFRKTFNDVKMVMMIHSETTMLGYSTNAIQLQRLNKSNDIFCSDSENVLEKITM